MKYTIMKNKDLPQRGICIEIRSETEAETQIIDMLEISKYQITERRFQNDVTKCYAILSESSIIERKEELTELIEHLVSSMNKHGRVSICKDSMYYNRMKNLVNS